MIIKFCMRNLLIIWKISTEKNFENSKKKIFAIFFLKFFFKIVSNFFDFSFVLLAGGAGGVGERSEPSAGGLAVGAEGSVNSEFWLILKQCA